MKTGPKPRPLADRFWDHVQISAIEQCWLWTGYLDKKSGRGNIGVGSKSDPSSIKRLSASRVSYELAYGSIPDGMFVCHRCDTPRCVNPNHLFLGTQKDNMQDASTKGRMHNKYQSEKTHCKEGHPFNEKNTLHIGRHRRCRICCRQRNRRSYQKLHARPRPSKYAIRTK